jgi:hypothetical protein
MLPVVNRLGNGIGISFPSEKWFWVQGLRFKVQGSGFWVQGSRFKVLGSRFRVQGFGFWVQSSRFRV